MVWELTEAGASCGHFLFVYQFGIGNIVVTRRDVTRRTPLKQPIPRGVWKNDVTLYGYRIPPSILKKTVGVLEIRPEQDHHVWFPPKRPSNHCWG